MVSQADYTHHEATLVPEGLRAYRHFTASLAREGGLFEPPAYHLFPMSQGGAYPPQFGPYEAQCRKAAWPDVSAGDPHTSPDPSCRCGFYASYDPDTDFYPQTVWGKDFHGRESGGTFTVRTVVEMSGRTVMGVKGVRAQKMKVVAVAVDWSKFIWHDEGDGVAYGEVWPMDWKPSYAARIMAARTRVTPNEEEVGYYERLASTLAYTYGAKYFQTVLAMHEAFPKPDIEHLKPKEPVDEEGVSCRA